MIFNDNRFACTQRIYEKIRRAFTFIVKASISQVDLCFTAQLLALDMQKVRFYQKSRAQYTRDDIQISSN